MRKNIYASLSIIAITIVLFSNCDLHQTKQIDIKYVNSEPLWQDKSIVMEEIDRIGTDDLRNDKYIFGLISSIETDRKGYLYVLDLGLLRITIYKPDGALFDVIELKQGNGPGEVQQPSALAVGHDGLLYINDMNRYRIIILDHMGNYIHEFSTKFRISQLEVDKTGNIYVAGFLFGYQGPIIHKYNAHHEFEYAFCKRYKNLDPLFEWTGNSGRIAVDNVDNKVYYSFEYPYEIREFNSSGDFLNRFSRKLNCYRSPIIINANTRSLESRAATKGLYKMSDGKLLHIYMCLEKNKANYYIDLFDKEQHYLKTVHLNKFGIDSFRMSCIDNKDNLYLDSTNPYPQIVKYKLEIK